MVASLASLAVRFDRTPPPEAWDDALCWRRPDLDWYTTDAEEEKTCKNVCYSCPVRRECLQWALDQHVIDGVWGGAGRQELRSTFSVNEHAEPVKRRAAVQCPYCLSKKVKLIEQKRRRRQFICETCQLDWVSLV